MPLDAPPPAAGPQERSITLPYTMVVFETEVTDAMRAAKTARQRHFGAWKAVFRADTAELRAAFEREARLHIKGFESTLTDANKTFIYGIRQEIFLKLATMAALSPDRIVGQDGTEHDAGMALLVAGSLAEYQASRAKLELPVKTLLQARVEPYLIQLMKLPPDAGGDQMMAAQAAQNIAEKLTLLDPRAILALIERRGRPSDQVGQVVYSHRLALIQLQNLEYEVDTLLAQSLERTALLERGTIALGEAIPLLQPFGRVWQITEQLKSVATANTMFWGVTDDSLRWVLGNDRGTASRGLWRTQAEKERYDLYRALRQALKLAGADADQPIADYNGRKKAFIQAMGPVMQRIALRSLADLRMRLADADKQGHAHYEAIYNHLLALTQKRGLVGAADAASKPGFKELAADFPLMGYPPFANKALVLFAKWSDPERKNWTVRRSMRFAYEINSDLVRLWTPRAKRAEREIKGSMSKVWLADALIPLVLSEFKVKDDSFLFDVAHARHLEAQNDISLLDILVAIISVALAFVPGGGALVALARVAVTGYEVYALNEEKNDFLTANALYTVGQSSKEPSELGVILAAAGLGVDLPGFARMIGTSANAAQDALRTRKLTSLSKTANTPRDVLEEFYEAYLREKRAGQLELLWKRVGDLQVVGCTPILIKEVAAFAEIAGKIGLNYSYEAFAKVTRKILRAEIPDRVMKEAFENSTLTADVSAQVFKIDNVHEGVKALAARQAAVETLEKTSKDLLGKMDDALERLDEVGFDALAKSYDRAQKELTLATIDLGHSTQMRAILKDRIAELKGQLDLSGDYFSAVAHNAPTRGRPAAGLVQYRRLGEVVYDQKQYLELQLKTLNQILDGTPLTPTGRWMAHETFVTDWLRRQFDEVGYQVKVEVSYFDGTTDTIWVDNLVRLPDVSKTPRFQIYDAKFSEVPAKGQVSQGALRQKLSDGPQKRGYLGLVNGQVTRARITDPRAQKLFGINKGAPIHLDKELVLVLNTRAGPPQDIVLKPQK